MPLDLQEFIGRYLPHGGIDSRRAWFRITAADPCPWCGCRMTHTPDLGNTATKDHIVPRSRGGPNRWANVTAVCIVCNRAKGDRSVLEHLAQGGALCNSGAQLYTVARQVFGDTLEGQGRSARYTRRALFYVASRVGLLDSVRVRLPRKYASQHDAIAGSRARQRRTKVRALLDAAGLSLDL